MKDCLSASEEEALTYYLALGFSAPVSGVVIGGVITTYYGGYNDPKGQIL
jgi:hypothetical protein